MLLCTCVALTLPDTARASDQPLALEGIASYFPFTGADLRIGAGVAFFPNKPIYVRADVVEHAAGLSFNHRFTVLNSIELSAGVSAYYEFGTQRIRPAVTVARLLF